MDETEKIWMDGKFVDWKDAKIHVLTHSLHYGSGVFEGIRFYKTEKGPAIFRLKEHVERLLYSAQALKMKIPFSKEEIMQAIKETVKINKIDEGYIRPISFFGYGKMGLNPEGASLSFAIAVWPWGAYLGEEAVKIKTSKFIRIHPKSLVADAKICGHYVNSILANLEAKEAGFDEALLLDYKNNIAEGPGENLFIAKNDVIKTPKLGTILPGITRDSIIKIARDLGYEVKEENLKLEDLYMANEAWYTGTAAEVTAIKQVDGKTIGNGKIGPITKILKEKYSNIVKGKDKKYLDWLTFVK